MCLIFCIRGFCTQNTLRSSIGDILWRNSWSIVVEVATSYQPLIMLDLNIQVWSWSHRMEAYVGESLQGWSWSHELEVHGTTNYYRRHLWDSKLSSVIVVRFTMNRVILIVYLYLILNLFTSGLIRSSPPRFFL